MRILLDTNAYSALARGEASLAERVRSAERILVSSIVAGELLHGFRRGNRHEANCRQFNAFLARPFVELLPVGLITADRFARIMAALHAKGRPIPTNDAWIAAHAMETGAELLSRDAHFGEIDGLVWTSF
ncbi:MAG: type II toxin-antitoxin system VapC family toxin [Nitrococcus sp.]|nr:type II toxin-antitoxin system VapC family toxin [Nitrococcus sp.]